MRKDFKYSINQGLPGGANELKKFVQGSISVTGYKSDSPDVNNDFNIIPSNRITMQGVNFPVLGVDDFGYEQMMMPGGEYSFPGNYVTEIPQMGKGGLTQWFAEDWTDVKTGKKCGRSGKEKSSRPYPACRPKKRVNETTPKTISEMSAAEKAKFKRKKKSGKRINYNHKRKEFGGEAGWLDQYQFGGNYAGQDLIKKSGDWYTTQEWDDAMPDSALENITEFFDPTGLTSHDDARRAYREWKASGSTYPTLGQGLDMFGAVPALGKLSKFKYLANPKAMKSIYKYFPWQDALNKADAVQDEYSKKHGGWLNKYQEGGNIDPEFMFKNKYNTELTPSEEADFSKWAAKESERQGRDILNDIGAYDVKGFWKSGDYKNMDSDNHGTDTWKKPNHPTFSNQSRYHGADGWYGGNWTDKAGYQPSKQTLETYGPDYYDWMFKSEPGRSEYLDMSRYESGANAPSPFIYQIGGHIIQPGETFYGIANKYGIPNKDLLGANTDVNIDKIRAGQRIRIPESFSQNQYPTGYFETSDSETFNRKSKVYPAPKKETQVKISRDLNNDLLLRQAFAESTFNPKAVSPAGYMGLAQIGNDVITDYKKATGVKNVDPYDPKQNAEVQKWAMNQIYNADFVNKEGQDPSVRVAKTLASYNWGKGNVLKHLKKQKAKGVDIYNSLDWVESLPKETRDYIHKIQLSDMPEFNKGFDKAIKDKQYKQYIDLYKKKNGGQTNWLDKY